jgi:hypothetical protein
VGVHVPWGRWADLVATVATVPTDTHQLLKQGTPFRAGADAGPSCVRARLAGSLPRSDREPLLGTTVPADHIEQTRRLCAGVLVSAIGRPCLASAGT